MAKKSHKKLRELARLHSLHGGSQLIQSASDSLSSSAPTTVFATSSAGKTNHLHAELVRRDLRDLLGLIVLMVVLLLGMYWLVGNTAFAAWLLSLGQHIR